MRLAEEAAGGQELRATSLSSDLFEGGGAGGLTKDLIAMKVAELKVALEARSSEGKSGNKVWLRRRLHAAIVREHLEGQMDHNGRRSVIPRANANFFAHSV